MHRHHRNILATFLGLAAATLASAQDCVTWPTTTGNGPPGCLASSMVYDSQRHRAVWIGGFNQQPPFQVWEWDGAAWADRTPASPPNIFGRIPGFVYDSDRGVCVLFAWLGSTWEYDGAAWVNRGLPGPSNRVRTTMAYDSRRHFTTLFGGSFASNYYTDTWIYDGDQWQQLAPAHSPTPRDAASMTFDTRRNVVVLHGGLAPGATNTIGDTWEFDGLDWTQVATDGPQRYGFQMVYDEQSGMTVVFDGYSVAPGGQPVSQYSAWGWDGVSWRYLGDAPVNTYFPSAFASAAYDTEQGEIVHQQTAQAVPGSVLTVHLRLGFPSIYTQPQSVNAQEGSLAAFGVTANSAKPLTYQWKRNGQNVSGATTSILLLHNATPAMAGDYTCVVSSACGTVTTQPAHLAVAPVCQGDFNHDGVRNFADLNSLLSVYGTSCTPQ